MAYTSLRSYYSTGFQGILFALTATATVLVSSAVATAEDFRVETKVFLDDKETPVSEATTLFRGSDVYDFLKTPAQTAVFRKPNEKNPGRFILLHDGERIRTEISTDQVAGAIEKVREWAARQTDPFLKFAANPEFEETFEPRSGQLVLASHLESYRVETTPAKYPRAAAQYREFLDWYAQLNTLLNAGPPPQPRLELNKSLARHKAVPKTVELLRTAGDNETLRAEHDFTWRLSQEDMQRIDDVHAALAAYRDVPNDVYLERTRGTDEEE